MEVSYQHANRGGGNESFLIRVSNEYDRRTSCVLVDAGEGVDLDELLGEDDDLVAILLTHAHLDHYQSLDDAHRDAAPVYATPGTAAVLGDVLVEAERNFGFEGSDRLLERVEPIADRVELLGGDLSFRPVPVGHAPGAGGFLIEAADGDATVRMLATGDFTERDAAGYPGFDPGAYADVDVLFLTAATADGAGARLTEIVGTVAERTNAGSRTLVTASGLTGVHLATLFAALADELDYSLPTVLVGQVAKLYDDLGYEHANVESVTEFSDPAACLDRGTVTVAGPETPTGGSSGRLFEALRGDPNASLVQVRGGDTDVEDGGGFAGTVATVDFSNHPTDAVLDDVVESISPIHVVVEHQRRHGLRAYTDTWDSFTWANWDDEEEVLYRDGRFVAPPWVGDAVERRVRTRDGRSNGIEVDDDVLEAASSYPSLARRESVSLTAEGLDVDVLRERLRVETPTPAEPTADATPSADVTRPDFPSMADGGLHRTVGRDLPEVGVDFDADTRANGADGADGLVDTVRSAAQRTRSSSGDGDGTSSAGDARSADTDASGETTADDETVDADSPCDERASDDVTDEAAEPDETSADDRTTEAPSEFTFDVDPAVRALAERRATSESVPLDDVVYDAVETYLAAIVRGDDPWVDREGLIERRFDVEADPAFERLLAAGADGAGSADTDSFVLRTVCEALGFDGTDRTLAVSDIGPLVGLVDAAVANGDCPHGTRDELVQAALEATVVY